MIQALATAFDLWCSETTIWPLTPKCDTESVVARFYEDYLVSPFRDQAGGSRFNNLLWLHLLARASGPSLVIDSGTYRGASAWALSTALTDCPIFSFDIDLSSLAHRVPGVSYIQKDWFLYDFNGRDLSKSLAYFDDHIDQGRRLREAADRGVSRLVFDDDFPVTSFSPMAHAGAALPKIEFILDRELDGVSELTWIDRARDYTFPINHASLDDLRSQIDETNRLPNTSLITGIHQTPYRLVRVRAKRGSYSYRR